MASDLKPSQTLCVLVRGYVKKTHVFVRRCSWPCLEGFFFDHCGRLVYLGQVIGGLDKSVQVLSSRGHAFKSPAFLIHENWFCTVVSQQDIQCLPFVRGSSV